MKKLINDPKRVVSEMLEGLVDTSAHLALLEGENVVLRADLAAPAERPVAIVSGGGSGHEPAHAAYVGRGMLTAAVCGDVFTSPSVDAILAAILASAGPRGALLIVKNYTGDRLNFMLAAELAREQGIPTEIVIVGDDVSLEGTVPLERRRGIAGTVFVHKAAGAAAQQGLDLTAVSGVARSVAARLATMGVGLTACVLPAVGAPGFTLGDTEIELGLGIHGEKGVRLPLKTGVLGFWSNTEKESRNVREEGEVHDRVSARSGTPSQGWPVGLGGGAGVGNPEGEPGKLGSGGRARRAAHGHRQGRSGDA